MAELTPIDALSLDPKIAKRLSTTLPGQPIVIMPCDWKGKPAWVALSTEDIAFISSGMTGRTAATGVQVSSLTMRSESAGLLAMAGDRFELKFNAPGDAIRLAGSIAALTQRKREEGARVLAPLRLAEHERLLRYCTYLGGAHIPVQPGTLVDLVFREDSLQIFASPARGYDEAIRELPFNARFTMDLSGPGKVTKGGGFIGGGVGLVGAAEGIAIASLLNKLTTKTSIVTVLMVADDSHEGFFLNKDIEPGALRQVLSPIFVRLRQLVRLQESIVEQPTDDLVSKLERLAALHRSGVLDDAEFVAAKQALIAGR